MKTRIDEIAPDLFRISTYFSSYDLQFNQFLVVDDDVLLYHTGMRKLFPLVKEAVAKVVEPKRIRWIGFSHFEADECGSLNEWLGLAPHAECISGTVAAIVNLNDYAQRHGRILAENETLSTGRHRYRLIETPQVPHSWDASLLLEETESVLFCSDLFLQNGDVAALTEIDLLDSARQALVSYEAGPLRHMMAYTGLTKNTLETLAGMQPKLLAIMHGSSFKGAGANALRALSQMYEEILVP